MSNSSWQHGVLGSNCRRLPVFQPLWANNAVEQDRPKAALLGSLRGFAAPAASHGKR